MSVKHHSDIIHFAIAEPTDNASVAFVKYKGDYYVSTETNFMHRVDPESLDSVEKVHVLSCSSECSTPIIQYLLLLFI